MLCARLRARWEKIGKGFSLRRLVAGKVGGLLPDILASGNPERVALHHARRPRVGGFSVQ